MKKLVSGLVVSGCLLLLCSGLAFAKGTAGVANTWHNLSTTGPVAGMASYATNEDEVCIFCHTPHGGNTTGPLWNRSLPGASTYTQYNSVTLSSYLQGLSASRPVNDESLLCLSCHDGTISVNHLLNTSNDIGIPETTFVMMGDPTDTHIINLGAGGPNLGTDLSDDHPISFSYDSVLGDAIYQPGGARVGQLRSVGTTVDITSALGWQGEGVRFFGADHRVECSSCHDPHVDYITNTAYRPFLIRPNTGSALCLACHNK
ncbi:putative extracellular tetraheme cytochrome c [Desulfuromonas sp. DDH964]|nr:putative extracellular tetraheme cytochrome c [Desulfuromonas sp. DDH964]